MRRPGVIAGLVIFTLALIGFVMLIVGPPPYRHTDDESPYKKKHVQRHVPKTPH